MTLINYLTRVHFADWVLEEALHSELELHSKKRPLVIADPADLSGAFAERFFSGFPQRSRRTVFEVDLDGQYDEDARKVAELYRDKQSDILIAVGGRQAIGLAKESRQVIWEAGGHKQKLKTAPPDLFVVPGVDALPHAVSTYLPSRVHRADDLAPLSQRAPLPTVAICDPTITHDAGPQRSASAGVSALACCIETYLSNADNPPADGIAIEGIRRGAGNLHRIFRRRPQAVARREMMAAGLNGGLSQQKGIGMTQALGHALSAVSGRDLDPGAVSRVLLPGVLRFNAKAAREKYQPLRQILGVGSRQSLADGVASVFADLPLPNRLSEIELTQSDLKKAAPIAADQLAASTSPRTAGSDDLYSIMNAVL